MTLDRSRPFVLLDDARGEGAAAARLYRDPGETIATDDPAKLSNCLSALRYAAAHGLHAAGWIAYDAGALGEAVGRPFPGLAGGLERLSTWNHHIDATARPPLKGGLSEFLPVDRTILGVDQQHVNRQRVA